MSWTVTVRSSSAFSASWECSAVPVRARLLMRPKTEPPKTSLRPMSCHRSVSRRGFGDGSCATRTSVDRADRGTHDHVRADVRLEQRLQHADLDRSEVPAAAQHEGVVRLAARSRCASWHDRAMERVSSNRLHFTGDEAADALLIATRSRCSRACCSISSSRWSGVLGSVAAGAATRCDDTRPASGRDMDLDQLGADGDPPVVHRLSKIRWPPDCKPWLGTSTTPTTETPPRCGRRPAAGRNCWRASRRCPGSASRRRASSSRARQAARRTA